jgi:hypothetical protein
VLPAVQEKFAGSYRAAGGECQLEIFAGCEHTHSPCSVNRKKKDILDDSEN